MESVGSIAVFIPKPKIRVRPVVRGLDHLGNIIPNGRSRQWCKFVQMWMSNVATSLQIKKSRKIHPKMAMILQSLL